jgi:uncharacterized membrane protein YqjE
VADGRPGGLSDALARLGGSALDLLRTRFELATIEFGEEQERRIEQLVLIGVAAVAFAFALFAASALVVVYFWATYRLEVLAGVALVYIAIGCGAIWRLTAQRRRHPRPFATTIAELERDRQFLAGQFGERES